MASIFTEVYLNSQVAGLLKIAVGVGIVALIYIKTPIWEILWLFFYIVIIPLSLMVAFGLISNGTLDALQQNVDVWKFTLGDRVDAYLRKFGDEIYENVDHMVEQAKKVQAAPVTVGPEAAVVAVAPATPAPAAAPAAPAPKPKPTPPAE
jgi:K+-transporting ATPase A subunit